MLDRIWAQIACKWPVCDQKDCSKFAKCRPPAMVF